jgi:hypothetical protein
MLGIALAAGLSIGLVTGPANAGAKPKPKPAGCTPGSIKTDQRGDKYVCDTHGKWVWVLDLVSGTVTGAVQVAAADEAAQIAVRAEKKGGGSASVTCPLNGGGPGANPGDKLDHVQYTRDAKGNLLTIEHTYYVCGEDGNWHQTVKRVVAGGAQVTQVSSTIAQAQIQAAPTPVAPAQAVLR